jgi:type IV pilus assembly protein PilO
MPRNYKAALKDPRVVMRVIIGALLAANLVAAVLAFKPFGGSTDDLRREQADLRRQLTQAQARLAATKQLVSKVETARREGDEFLTKYFTDRRTTYSTIIDELDRKAQDAGVKPRDRNLELNDIEGSDTLEMMSLSVGYEGKYDQIRKFVSLLDKSPRFLIIESMQASPQQNGDNVTVTLKLDTFVKQEPNPEGAPAS